MGNADKTVYLWDLQTPSAMPVVLSGFETQPFLTFSQDNNWLVTSGGRIRLWKMQNLTADPIDPIILGEKREYYNAIAVSSDTNWLAAKSEYEPVQLWNMKELSEPPILLTFESSTHLFWNNVYDLSLGPDGKLLAGACGDEIVRLEYAKPELSAHYTNRGRLCWQINF